MKKIYLSVLAVSILSIVACGGGETKVEMPAALDSAAASVENAATALVDSAANAATTVMDSATATVEKAVEAAH